MFTAIPIMWYALFDFEYEKEDFMKNPKHYEIGLKEHCFGVKIFWGWILYAAVYALVLLFANFVVMSYALNEHG